MNIRSLVGGTGEDEGVTLLEEAGFQVLKDFHNFKFTLFPVYSLRCEASFPVSEVLPTAKIPCYHGFCISLE